MVRVSCVFLVKCLPQVDIKSRFGGYRKFFLFSSLPVVENYFTGRAGNLRGSALPSHEKPSWAQDWNPVPQGYTGRASGWRVLAEPSPEGKGKILVGFFPQNNSSIEILLIKFPP